MTKPIVCIGSATMDMVFSATSGPRPDGKVLAEGFDLRPGGASVNAALAIRRQGGEAEVWARLGDDHMGRLFRTVLKDTGVSSAGLAEAKGHGTTVASIVQSPTSRSIVVRPDLDLPPCLEQVHTERLKDAGAVLVTQRWPEAAAPALDAARAAGIPGILNMEISRERTPEDFVNRASHVVFSEEGLAHWTGESNPIQGMRAARRLVPDAEIMATMGKRGILFFKDDAIMSIRAVIQPTVVDALGAGDVFQGVLAQSLVEGHNTQSAIQRGMAAAAIKVGREGIHHGAATSEETDALVTQQQTALRPIRIPERVPERGLADEGISITSMSQERPLTTLSPRFLQNVER